MKKMRIRMTEGVDETRLFSASIRGGREALPTPWR